MDRFSTKTYDLYHFIVTMRECYQIGCFNRLLPLLSDDCLLESHLTSSQESGKTAVINYFEDSCYEYQLKDSLSNYGLVEILSTPDASRLEGQFALNLKVDEELFDESSNDVLIIPKMGIFGKIEWISVVESAQYIFQVFQRYIEIKDVCPASQVPQSSFFLPDIYEDFLQLGLIVSGWKDTSKNTRFSMQQLHDALYFWMAFCISPSFDIAFEEMCGINYNDGYYKVPEAAELLGRKGKQMWDNRKPGLKMFNTVSSWAGTYNNQNAMFYLYHPQSSDSAYS